MDHKLSDKAGSGNSQAAGSNEEAEDSGFETAVSGKVVRTGEQDESPGTGVIFPGRDGAPDTILGEKQYLKNRGIVHRAIHILEGWKFMTARISSSRVPVDIIALRRDMALLVQVISSKHPIPNAKKLVKRYAAKIRALRRMGTSLQFRKVLMAHSMPCGWKYYDVLPGGVIPAWDLYKHPAA